MTTAPAGFLGRGLTSHLFIQWPLSTTVQKQEVLLTSLQDRVTPAHPAVCSVAQLSPSFPCVCASCGESGPGKGCVSLCALVLCSATRHGWRSLCGLAGPGRAGGRA